MAHGETHCPSSCTIYKYIDHRKGVEEQPTVQFDQGSLWPLEAQWPHEACRQERPGSCWSPGSQSGVSSVAPGSGLQPLSRGQGELVVPRLCGVSMEVDHPGGGSRGRRGHDGLVVMHLFRPTLGLMGVGPPSTLHPLTQVHATWQE